MPQSQGSFVCAKCGLELVTEIRARSALGLVYAVPASFLGYWVQKSFGGNLTANSLEFQLLALAAAVSVALPTTLLVLRGIVYTPAFNPKHSSER